MVLEDTWKWKKKTEDILAPVKHRRDGNKNLEKPIRDIFSTGLICEFGVNTIHFFLTSFAYELLSLVVYVKRKKYLEVADRCFVPWLIKRKKRGRTKKNMRPLQNTQKSETGKAVRDLILKRGWEKEFLQRSQRNYCNYFWSWWSFWWKGRNISYLWAPKRYTHIIFNRSALVYYK